MLCELPEVNEHFLTVLLDTTMVKPLEICYTENGLRKPLH